jgi:hypothetical protein
MSDCKAPFVATEYRSFITQVAKVLTKDIYSYYKNRKLLPLFILRLHGYNISMAFIELNTAYAHLTAGQR